MRPARRALRALQGLLVKRGRLVQQDPKVTLGLQALRDQLGRQAKSARLDQLDLRVLLALLEQRATQDPLDRQGRQDHRAM